ncbi:MAG: hypothetical protein KF752_17960 [Pirellulaceae bacterium]|nr:hypothetical protein [Pirellulaceae bacterium]
MEFVIDLIGSHSAFLAPALTAWAMLTLYVQPKTEIGFSASGFYFVVLLMVAVLTMRTTMVHDKLWLIHAASLGVLIVGGVLWRPSESGHSIVAVHPQDIHF